MAYGFDPFNIFADTNQENAPDNKDPYGLFNDKSYTISKPKENKFDPYNLFTEEPKKYLSERHQKMVEAGAPVEQIPTGEWRVPFNAQPKTEITLGAEKYMDKTLFEKAALLGEKALDLPVIKQTVKPLLSVIPTFYKGYYNTLGEFSKDLEYLTSRFGENPISKFFGEAGNSGKYLAETMDDAGVPKDLAGRIVTSLGGAAGDLTKLTVTAPLGVANLPVHGGLRGAREAKEAGKSPLGQLGAVLPGAIEGALMDRIMKGTGELKPIPRALTNFGVFAGMRLASGASLEDALTEGFMTVGFGQMGGKKGASAGELKQTLKEAYGPKEVRAGSTLEPTASDITSGLKGYIKPEGVSYIPTREKTEGMTLEQLLSDQLRAQQELGRPLTEREQAEARLTERPLPPEQKQITIEGQPVEIKPFEQVKPIEQKPQEPEGGETVLDLGSPFPKPILSKTLQERAARGREFVQVEPLPINPNLIKPEPGQVPTAPDMPKVEGRHDIKLVDEQVEPTTADNPYPSVTRRYQNDINATIRQGYLEDGTPYNQVKWIDSKKPGSGAGNEIYKNVIDDANKKGGVLLDDSASTTPAASHSIDRVIQNQGLESRVVGVDSAGKPQRAIFDPMNFAAREGVTPPVTPPITPPPGGTGVPGETPSAQEPRLVESKVRSNTGEKIGIKEQLPKEEFMYPESTHPWRDEQVKQRVQSEGEQNIINRIESQGVKDEIDNVFVGEKINELKKDLSPENIDKIRSLAKRAQVFGTEAGKNVESFKQWQESFAGRVKVAEQVVAAVEKQPRLKKKMKEVEAEINALKGKVARTPNLQQKRKILTEEFRKKYPKRSASEIKAEVNKTLNPDGKTDWSSFEQAVKTKLKIPVLDDSTIKMIKEYSDKIDALPKDSIARIEWEGRLSNKIGELMPVTFKEKLALYQTMSMLLRPRSPIKNLVGNTLFEGITRIVNKVAVPIDMLFALRNKGRTIAWSTGAELKESWIKTFASKFAQDAKYALEGLDINHKLLEKRIKEVMTGEITDHDLNEILYKRQAVEEQGGKFELGQKQVFKSRAGKMAMATLAITMRSTDRAAFWARFENSLANQIAAGQIKKGYSGVNPNMVEQAIGEGLQVTFQNKTLGTWAALGLKRALNKYLYFGGEAFMKFVKTPLNIINQGIEHSPLGSVKAIVNTIRLMKAGKDIRTEHGILEGKAAEYGSLQRQTAIEWGRTLTGTGVMLLGYMLAKNGAMTGGEPDEEIKKLNIATGKGNRSINTSAGLRWLASGFQLDQLIPKPDDDIKDYDWLGPLAIPLSIGANIYQYEQIPESKLNANQKMLKVGGAIVDMYLAAADVVAEQPMTQGLRMLAGGKKVTDIVGNLIKNVPASFIPQLASDIALLTSSTLKDVRENNSVSEAWNMMKKRIPGVSNQLPVKVNVLGQKMEIFEPKRTDFEKFWDVATFFVKPWIAKKYKAEPGIQFVETLYRKTGEAKVLPRDVTNTSTISYQGKKIPLSQENRLRYQEITGQLFSKYVRENLEALKGMDNTDDQVAFMHEILNEVGKDARNQWLIEQGY